MIFPINRIFSQRVTPRLAALRLSPNQVTLLSLGAGLWGAWCFLRGDPKGWILGALALQVSYVLDNCDGELARMTGRSSGLGSWLDTLSDCLIHMAFFLSLGIGLYRVDADPRWQILGVVTAGGVFLTYLTYLIEQVQQRGREAWIHPDPPGSEQPERFTGKLKKVLREDFSLVVLASALLGRMGWLLVAGLIGAALYSILNLVSIARRAGGLRKISFLRVGGFLVGAGLFLFVLNRADLPAVWQLLRQNFHWQFAVILLFYGVIFGLDTFGWRYTLNPQAISRVRWDRLFRARLAGEAVNYVTPAAWIGGEPVKAMLLSRRHGVPMADGIASVVVAKTTFTFSMLLFILTGLVVALLTQKVQGSLFSWVWTVLPVLTVLLALFLVVQFFHPFRRMAGLFERIAPRWFQSLEAKVQEWDHAIVGFYRRSPKALLYSLGFHFLGWMAGAVEVYLILRFLKLPVSWATAWSIEALWVLLKSGAFLIPASLGASEGVALLICMGLGVGAVSGLTMALIRRARELVWVGLGLLEFSRE